MNKKLSKEMSARTTDESSTKAEDLHVSPCYCQTQCYRQAVNYNVGQNKTFKPRIEKRMKQQMFENIFAGKEVKSVQTKNTL